MSKLLATGDLARIDRRGFLKCMAWAGAGMVWAMKGGILTARAFGFSSDLIWFVLFLGTGVALAEWHAIRRGEDT